MKSLSKKETARRLRSAAERSAPDIWENIEKRLDHQPYEFEQPVRGRKSMRLPALAAAVAAIALTVGVLLSWPWNRSSVPPDISGSSERGTVLREGTDYTIETAGPAGNEGNHILDSLEAARVFALELRSAAEAKASPQENALTIVEGYDAAFFEDHVVLVIVRPESSSHMTHRVQSVSIEDGGLVAKVEPAAASQAGDRAVTPLSLFVEVKRSAIKGCSAYYVEENGVREQVYPVKESQDLVFRSRAALVDCPDDGKWGPDVQLLYSVEDLEEYLHSLGQADLSGDMGTVSATTILNSLLENGFPDHPLAVIRVRETGAQTRHRVKQIRADDGLTITLQRLTQPEEIGGSYCWMIFVELLADDGQWTGCKLDIEDQALNTPAYSIVDAPVFCVDEAVFTTEYGLYHTAARGIRSLEEWWNYLEEMGSFLDFSYTAPGRISAAQLHERYDSAFFEDRQLIAVTVRDNGRADHCGVVPLRGEDGTWTLSTGDSLPYQAQGENAADDFSWQQIYIELPRDAGMIPTGLHMTDQLYSYAWPEPNSTMTSVNGVLIRDLDGDGMPEIFRVDMEQNRPVLKVNGQTVAGLSTDIEWLFMPELQAAEYLDLDGKPVLLISLPTGGSGGDTFLAAAKKMEDGWKVFPLPSFGEVSGFGVSVKVLEADRLLVSCPETGFQQIVELPEPFDGYREDQAADPNEFFIDGALEGYDMENPAADRKILRIRQMIWTEWHANSVAWLETSFTLGPDGWTVLEQTVVPDIPTQSEVPMPSQRGTNP